ncbi:MAG: dTDP-4-dehydrorhamnose 3,5-epimerase [Pirellulales bacterium]
MMHVVPSELPEVLRIEPRVYRDARGSFAELWRQEAYARHGMAEDFVQDNVAVSHRGVIRGLHFQHPRGQGKLILVMHGEVFDVAVDVRRGSPTFGCWTSTILSDRNHRQLYVPVGFAHGYCVTSESAVVAYKCTSEYAPHCERTIVWNDPQLGIPWPAAAPLLSPKDAAAPTLSDLSADELPLFSPFACASG